jgi:hypothetical protein
MSDPTDPGGVGAQAERARTTTRVGDSGSPVGSPLTIVLALIAVVVGFLIFRSIDDSNAGGLEDPAGGSTTAPAATTTAAGAAAPTTAATATTAATRVTDGATVIVANASSAGGVAAQMTQQLETAGYATADPTDATGANLDTSVVYYIEAPPQIQTVAQSVARDLGGVDAQPMPSAIPVDGASIGTATVLVMLGDDLAGQSLADIVEEAGANVEAPAPASGATTTTSG